jgi:hypothetical protein
MREKRFWKIDSFGRRYQVHTRFTESHVENLLFSTGVSGEMLPET